jgi:hypothetical protein
VVVPVAPVAPVEVPTSIPTRIPTRGR